MEETFKTGKDVLGWDQSQVRNWDAICRHTALAALAQLRGITIRNALCGLVQLPLADPGDGTSDADAGVDDADLRIPLGDAPVPAYPGQSRPRRLGLIRLSVAETARLTRSGFGRVTWRRRTAISCRSTKISTSLEVSLRASSATQPNNRIMSR